MICDNKYYFFAVEACLADHKSFSHRHFPSTGSAANGCACAQPPASFVAANVNLCSMESVPRRRRRNIQ